MSKTEITVSNLKINTGTYATIEANLSSIGENELIITDDKNIPVPTASDDGKVVGVVSGDFALITPSSGMQNPMTTEGDIIVGGSSGVATRLGIGTNGQVLTSDGTTASWQTPSGGIANGVAYEEVN